MALPIPGDLAWATPLNNYILMVETKADTNTSNLSAHSVATDPHGDRVYTVGQISTHSAATDPHGDRAWATGQFPAKNATIDVFNVTAYGAVGDGTTNCTSAIQAAITAVPTSGGIIYFPAGTYVITSALNLKSNIILMGAGTLASIIKQNTTSANCFNGSDVNNITMRDLQLLGPTTGTGTGVNLVRVSNPDVHYIRMDNVYIRLFGRDGISISNCIVSAFTRVVCENNGRYGIYLFGVVAGAAGTSVSMDACYANTNTSTGFNLYNMVYTSLNGCASEGQPTNFLLDTCQGVSLNGCGSEVMTSGGTGFKITGGFCNSLISCWDLTNKGKAFWLTGSTRSITLMGITENSPGVGATASLQVDAGCGGISLQGISNTTAMSLAAGTTNIINDGSNGITVHGYFYTDAASEFNGTVLFDGVTTHYGNARFAVNTQLNSDTEAFGGGTGVIGIANASVVPTTNPASGLVLYSQANVLKARDPSGTVTQIVPATGGGGGVSITGGSTIVPSGTGVVGLTVKAVTSQTADQLKIQDSVGADKLTVSPAGILTTTNAVLVTPTVASFVNATHNHNSAAGGGSVAYPRCSVRRAATVTAANNTDVTMTLDTVDYQYGATWWSAGSPTLITLPSTGFYMINVSATFENAGTNAGLRLVQLRKQSDNNPILEGSNTGTGGSSTDWFIAQAAGQFQGTAGQQFYINVRQTSGATITMFLAVVQIVLLTTTTP